MSKFRIEPHGPFQEWVADEKGYFKDEGLDYEFLTSYATQASGYALVQSTKRRRRRNAFKRWQGRAAQRVVRRRLGATRHGGSLPPAWANVGTRLRDYPLVHSCSAGFFD